MQKIWARLKRQKIEYPLGLADRPAQISAHPINDGCYLLNHNSRIDFITEREQGRAEIHQLRHGETKFCRSRIVYLLEHFGLVVFRWSLFPIVRECPRADCNLSGTIVSPMCFKG